MKSVHSLIQLCGILEREVVTQMLTITELWERVCQRRGASAAIAGSVQGSLFIEGRRDCLETQGSQENFSVFVWKQTEALREAHKRYI